MKQYVPLLALLALCLMTPARALEVSAQSAILMDGQSGEILYEKNADERHLIASTTKIMTAVVTLEQESLQTVVKIPAEAVGIEGSSMYLREGETLTVEQLLYGMLLSSGNDAAVALALQVGGSVEDFAALMNEKAAELGLENTHFANPNGLDSQENYGSARDLARLAAYALNDDTFRAIVSTKTFQAGDRVLVNHNKLLWRYPGAIGVKTGYTRQAGRILVGAAERNGRRLISVTISAPDDWNDHAAMLDDGFSRYQETVLVAEGQMAGALSVISGTAETVELRAGAAVSAYALPGETAELRLSLPPFVYAPVSEGDVLGSAEVYLNGARIGTVPLTAAAAVAELPPEPGPLERILEWVREWLP